MTIDPLVAVQTVALIFYAGMTYRRIEGHGKAITEHAGKLEKHAEQLTEHETILTLKGLKK